MQNTSTNLSNQDFEIWLYSVVMKTGNKQDYVIYDALALKLIESEYWTHLPASFKRLGDKGFLMKQLKCSIQEKILIKKERQVNGITKCFMILRGHKFKDKEYQQLMKQNLELKKQNTELNDTINFFLKKCQELKSENIELKEYQNKYKNNLLSNSVESNIHSQLYI